MCAVHLNRPLGPHDPNRDNLGQAQISLIQKSLKALKIEYTEAQVQLLLSIGQHMQNGIRRRTFEGEARKFTILKIDNKPYLLLTHSKEQNHPVIGTGDFKCVKVAINLIDGSKAAVSVLRDKVYKTHEPTMWCESWASRHEMALEEYQLGKKCEQQSGVLPFLGMYDDAARKKLYLLTPYCERGDFSHALPKATEKEIVQWTLEVMMGIKALHERNIVHQDLHLGNILIGKEKAYIADLGKAADFSSEPLSEEESREIEVLKKDDIKGFLTSVFYSTQGIYPYDNDRITRLQSILFHLMRSKDAYQVQIGSVIKELNSLLDQWDNIPQLVVDPKVKELIDGHPAIRRMAQPSIDADFVDHAQKGEVHSLNAIIFVHRFRISADKLGSGFVVAIQQNHPDCLKAILGSYRTSEISGNHLKQGFLLAAQRPDCLNALIASPLFKDITPQTLGEALVQASTNKDPSCLKTLIDSPRFKEISKADLELTIRGIQANIAECLDLDDKLKPGVDAKMVKTLLTCLREVMILDHPEMTVIEIDQGMNEAFGDLMKL